MSMFVQAKRPASPAKTRSENNSAATPSAPNLASTASRAAAVTRLVDRVHRLVRSRKQFSRTKKVNVVTSGPVPGNTVPYIVPPSVGGSELDSSAGLGEPLNIIISALSSAEVLSTNGIENWARSISYSTECLGLHIGNPQTANLGDGDPKQPEIAVIRQQYGNNFLGTCVESLIGGNHFRFWRQATTGAYFLACSVEETAFKQHNIAPNGYDDGRDRIVKAATETESGTTIFNGTTYSTKVEWIQGLLPAGSQGINHGIAIDGRVALLTVTITEQIPSKKAVCACGCK